MAVAPGCLYTPPHFGVQIGGVCTKSCESEGNLRTAPSLISIVTKTEGRVRCYAANQHKFYEHSSKPTNKSSFAYILTLESGGLRQVMFCLLCKTGRCLHWLFHARGISKIHTHALTSVCCLRKAKLRVLVACLTLPILTLESGG